MSSQTLLLAVLMREVLQWKGDLGTMKSDIDGDDGTAFHLINANNVHDYHKGADVNVGCLGARWGSNGGCVCSPEEGAGCVGVRLQLSGSGPPQSVQPLLGAPVQRLHRHLLVQAGLCPLQQGRAAEVHSQQHKGSGLHLCE